MESLKHEEHSFIRSESSDKSLRNSGDSTEEENDDIFDLLEGFDEERRDDGAMDGGGAEPEQSITSGVKVKASRIPVLQSTKSKDKTTKADETQTSLPSKIPIRVGSSTSDINAPKVKTKVSHRQGSEEKERPLAGQRAPSTVDKDIKDDTTKSCVDHGKMISSKDFPDYENCIEHSSEVHRKVEEANEESDIECSFGSSSSSNIDWEDNSKNTKGDTMAGVSSNKQEELPRSHKDDKQDDDAAMTGSIDEIEARQRYLDSEDLPEVASHSEEKQNVSGEESASGCGGSLSGCGGSLSGNGSDGNVHSEKRSKSEVNIEDIGRKTSVDDVINCKGPELDNNEVLHKNTHQKESICREIDIDDPLQVNNSVDKSLVVSENVEKENENWKVQKEFSGMTNPELESDEDTSISESISLDPPLDPDMVSSNHVNNAYNSTVYDQEDRLKHEEREIKVATMTADSKVTVQQNIQGNVNEDFHTSRKEDVEGKTKQDIISARHNGTRSLERKLSGSMEFERRLKNNSVFKPRKSESNIYDNKFAKVGDDHDPTSWPLIKYKHRKSLANNEEKESKSLLEHSRNSDTKLVTSVAQAMRERHPRSNSMGKTFYELKRQVKASHETVEATQESSQEIYKGEPYAKDNESRAMSVEGVATERQVKASHETVEATQESSYASDNESRAMSVEGGVTERKVKASHETVEATQESIQEIYKGEPCANDNEARAMSVEGVAERQVKASHETVEAAQESSQEIYKGESCAKDNESRAKSVEGGVAERKVKALRETVEATQESSQEIYKGEPCVNDNEARAMSVEGGVAEEARNDAGLVIDGVSRDHPLDISDDESLTVTSVSEITHSIDTVKSTDLQEVSPVQSELDEYRLPETPSKNESYSSTEVPNKKDERLDSYSKDPTKDKTNVIYDDITKEPHQHSTSKASRALDKYRLPENPSKNASYYSTERAKNDKPRGFEGRDSYEHSVVTKQTDYPDGSSKMVSNVMHMNDANSSSRATDYAFDEDITESDSEAIEDLLSRYKREIEELSSSSDLPSTRRSPGISPQDVVTRYHLAKDSGALGGSNVSTKLAKHAQSKRTKTLDEQRKIENGTDGLEDHNTNKYMGINMRQEDVKDKCTDAEDTRLSNVKEDGDGICKQKDSKHGMESGSRKTKKEDSIERKYTSITPNERRQQRENERNFKPIASEQHVSVASCDLQMDNSRYQHAREPTRVGGRKDSNDGAQHRSLDEYLLDQEQLEYSDEINGHFVSYKESSSNHTKAGHIERHENHHRNIKRSEEKATRVPRSTGADHPPFARSYQIDDASNSPTRYSSQGRQPVHLQKNLHHTDRVRASQATGAPSHPLQSVTNASTDRLNVAFNSKETFHGVEIPKSIHQVNCYNLNSTNLHTFRFNYDEGEDVSNNERSTLPDFSNLVNNLQKDLSGQPRWGIHHKQYVGLDSDRVPLIATYIPLTPTHIPLTPRIGQEVANHSAERHCVSQPASGSLTGRAPWISENVSSILEDCSIHVIAIPLSRGLGITVEEGTNGIYVDEVLEGGDAGRDGRILPGDRILAIDDYQMEDASLQQAKAVLCKLKRFLTSNNYVVVRFERDNFANAFNNSMYVTDPSLNHSMMLPTLPDDSETPESKAIHEDFLTGCLQEDIAMPLQCSTPLVSSKLSSAYPWSSPSIGNIKSTEMENHRQLPSTPFNASSIFPNTSCAPSRADSNASSLILQPESKVHLSKLESALSFLGLELTEGQKLHLRYQLHADKGGCVVYRDFVGLVRRIYEGILQDQMTQARNIGTPLGKVASPLPDIVPHGTVVNRNGQMEIMFAEKDRIRTEVSNLKNKINEKAKVLQAVQKELMHVRGDLMLAKDRKTKLKRKAISAEAAKKNAVSIAEDYEYAIKSLEKDISSIKTSSIPGTSDVVLKCAEVQNQIHSLVARLRRMERSKRNYFTATQKLMKFACRVYEVLHEDVYHRRQGSLRSLPSSDHTYQSMPGCKPSPALPRSNKMDKRQRFILDEATKTINTARGLLSSEPLPFGWEEAYTEVGTRYFINHLDGTTSWRNPSTDGKRSTNQRRLHYH